MNECDYIVSRTSFYLDDELRADERRAFEEHLASCQNCRDAVSTERRFLDSVREAGPLYETPFDLRRRIEEIASRGCLREAQAPETSSTPLALVAQPASRFARFGRIQRVASVSAIGMLLVLLGICYLRRPDEPGMARLPSEFAILAVDTHQKHLGGGLALEITSTSPETVSNWFADQVSFGVKLPNYQEASGQDHLYRIEGGAVVGFKNDRAAYVSYQMDKQPISLLVTSDSVAAPSGGEEIASKGITFHCDTINGLKVITWQDRGLTYALVSNLKERGQQSCLVCHQGTRDSDFLEGFNVGPPGGVHSSRTGRDSTAERLDLDGNLHDSASD